MSRSYVALAFCVLWSLLALLVSLITDSSVTPLFALGTSAFFGGVALIVGAIEGSKSDDRW
jgi:hypothetical protein